VAVEEGVDAGGDGFGYFGLGHRSAGVGRVGAGDEQGEVQGGTHRVVDAEQTGLGEGGEAVGESTPDGERAGPTRTPGLRPSHRCRQPNRDP
jgi:hypothetical protein